jgi:hypothetical protein
MPEIDVLRRLGDELVPPPLDELRELARRRDRRAAAATVVACAAAVALVAVALGIVGPGRDDSPAPAPAPGRETERPLTWADGTTVHYGDRTVEAVSPVQELDLTDDGVAFRTADGRIWFTDGSGVDQLGTVGEPGPLYGDDIWPAGVPSGWVVSGNTGSMLGWFEFPEPGAPELVVRDTATGEEVARAPVELETGSYAVLHTVDADHAYWYVDSSIDTSIESADLPMVRVDLATGVQTTVSKQEWQADVRSRGPDRMLVVSTTEHPPPPGEYPTPYVLTDQIWNLDAGGGHVTPQGPQPLTVLDARTARPFAFDIAKGYRATGPVWLAQWRDDDTVVLVAPRDGGTDLLECHVSSGACGVALSGPRIVVPEYGEVADFG